MVKEKEKKERVINNQDVVRKVVRVSLEGSEEYIGLKVNAKQNMAWSSHKEKVKVYAESRVASTDFAFNKNLI